MPVKVLRKKWRMPLHENYNKLMNSKNADMQNINYVDGTGSTTAAHTQRFIINKTPGLIRYSWNGVLKIWWSLKFWWSNRIWCAFA